MYRPLSRLFPTPARLAAILLVGVLALSSRGAHAEYAVTVDKSENRGTWEGWGCSLCWWANAVGGSATQDLYADLFFTRRPVPFLGKTLPGLGLNIVRYNVGGGGMGDKIGDTTEKVAGDLPWSRDIDGYWVNWNSPDPRSNSWDWTRDARQRAMLQAARKRGVDKVEFFANAPMWWMMDTKSSDGGTPQSWNRPDFARYLATVAEHAQKVWKIPVTNVEPFNEPAAGWWTFPHNQEGCNVPPDQQAEVLMFLRQEMDTRGLSKVPIAASDENSVAQARSTLSDLKARNGADLIGAVNVHGYSGLNPWRDNGAREALRRDAAGKRLWMSEYGDHDGSGMALAQTIVEDLTYLRPTAWVYWQPLEPESAWGLVNGKYRDPADQANPGAPTQIYTKYYVMAQFTRFLRPGDKLIGTNDHNSIVAYRPSTRQLILITVNYASAQPIHYDLTTLQSVRPSASVTETNTDGSKLLQASSVAVAGKKFTVNAEANSIYSVVLSGVSL